MESKSATTDAPEKKSVLAPVAAKKKVSKPVEGILFKSKAGLEVVIGFPTRTVIFTSVDPIAISEEESKTSAFVKRLDKLVRISNG